MPATVILVAGCLGVWIASLATGSSLWSATGHGTLDRDLARNAILITQGQWWRTISYATLNPSVPHVASVLALLFLAGLQVERTYGTVRFLAIVAPSWTTGALVALLVEPARAYNAGTSGVVFGIAAAAIIDLLRRGVPWHRTFWAPVLAILLVLGFGFPASITWGAHAGGLVAGSIMGFVACRPEKASDPDRRTALTVLLAAVLVTASLVAVSYAAHHTVDHGPILVGAEQTRS